MTERKGSSERDDERIVAVRLNAKLNLDGSEIRMRQRRCDEVEVIGAALVLDRVCSMRNRSIGARKVQ